ncbi:unnamed protein product, partial [Mesorhabditis belari]|uniref:Nucleolar protein 14 n=1 Tax=Mesorhabditis belari TaxID=2138241 RepID=A0AAF3EVZ2_9BILA
MVKKSKIKAKGSAVEAKPNPFDLKFNRQKHKILGRKKDLPGQPVLKKKTGIENRKKTLAVEVANVFKKNKIIDKRLGEKKAGLSADEKASKRFVALRKTPKSNKFNLSDENERLTLTHKGQALTMIEKFDRMEESESEGEEGALSAEIVARAHFGGGGLEQDDENNEQPKQRKNRADIIKEMIAKSKLEKSARQTEKDMILDTVDRLDDNFKNLVQKMSASKRDNTQKAPKKEMAAYDKTMLELKLSTEAKATPVDKMKHGALSPTREEVDCIKEDVERRKRLEVARKNSQANAEVLHIEDLAPKKVKHGMKVRFDSEGDVAGEMDDTWIDIEDIVDDPTEDSKEQFFISMPKKYEEFVQLLSKQQITDIPDCLKRIAKSNHPSLKEGNKNIIARLTLFTLRYYTDISKGAPTTENVHLLGQLIKIIYHLINFDAEHGVRCIRALLERLGKRFEKNNEITFMLISTLRLVFNVFPITSDFHPVSSPAISIASAAISSGHVKNRMELGRHILLCHIILDYVKETKKFFPELLAFISSVIQQAISDENLQTRRPITELFDDKTELLMIDEDLRSSTLKPLSLSEVFCTDASPRQETPLFAARLLASLLSVIQQVSLMYAAQYSHVYSSIFKPICEVIELVSLESFPTSLCEQTTSLLTHLKAECERTGPRSQMTTKQAEVKMLKMLEPRIDENFNPEQKHAVREGYKQGKRGETKKLQYQLKQERKGALKELRKDTQFIAKRQFESQKQLDLGRKKKVKEIMSGLQGQQSEHVMANYEPMPFVRKFGEGAGVEPSSTSKATIDSGFVDASGTAIMKTPVTGACRKCGFAGHLPYQCMNYIQVKKDQKAMLDISSTTSESEEEASVMRKKKEKLKKKKEKKKKEKVKKEKTKRRRRSSSSSSDSEEERRKKKRKRKHSTSSSSSGSEDERRSKKKRKEKKKKK